MSQITHSDLDYFVAVTFEVAVSKFVMHAGVQNLKCIMCATPVHPLYPHTILGQHLEEVGTS